MPVRRSAWSTPSWTRRTCWRWVSSAAAAGRPTYDPRDMLWLYVYGYLNELRSSRRLERGCRVNPT